ncbi:MAG: Leucine Rich Repeat (LRR)-containing protein [Bacteroidota bacterium]|jgi:Leucine-rich repeat (LRR) protein|nr:Leucine Rich Repeat (LRR)-containing protein [Bacteroidota bacterium]
MKFKFKATCYIFFLLLGFLPCRLSSQTELLDSLTLDTLTGFTNLEEAMKDPDKVIKLELRRKRLKEFPKEILQFKHLQYLDLSKNNIVEIPSSISELKDLQILILSKNEIESLPKEIGELKSLQYLNLNQNELSTLPPQIGSLSSLKNLDLWSNNIDKYPSEMKNLKSLLVLDVRVILIPDAEQERLQALLPKTKIYFSPYCKCQQ